MTLEQAYKLAVDHHVAGRLQQAEQLYRQILQVAPQQADTLHMLGLIAYAVGQPVAAIELIERALAINPSLSGALTNLGESQRVAGQLEASVQTFQRALAGDPNSADTYNNLALALESLGRNDESLAVFERSLSINPNGAPCLSNYANALHRANRSAESLALHERAIAADPRYAIAFNNYGTTLESLDRLHDAERAYRRATELDANFVEAWNNLGSAIRKFARFNEALACFERALALDPNHAGAGFNAGLVYLTRGEFARGWPLYERRFLVPGLQVRRDIAQPRWDGSPIAPGRTLFLHAEQGFGDMIQAARFLSAVVERKSAGAKLIVECHPELMTLFHKIEGIDELIEVGQPAPRFDVYSPMFSLMQILNTTLETIPREMPYLHVDRARVSQFGSWMPSGSKQRIGIAWRGSAGHQNDRDRSIAPGALNAFASVTNVQWISLQKGLAPGTPRPVIPMIDRTDELVDFSDTAALIANLDLVITVDTSVAHLAGALGKPVWLMVPTAPDWRWLLDREDSPWYPTMRIFRQPAYRDWNSVIAKIVEQLNRVS